MDPSSLKITSCEPAFAHFSAHSRLIGFSRFFVNAQAESNTYPSTDTLFCCPCSTSADAQNENASTPAPTIRFLIVFISPPHPAHRSTQPLLQPASLTSPAVLHNSQYSPARESFSCSADHPTAFAATISAAALPSTPPCRNPDSHRPPQIPCASSPRLPPAAPPAPSSLSIRSRSAAAPVPTVRGSRTPQNPASPPVSPPAPQSPPPSPSPPPTGNSPNARSP